MPSMAPTFAPVLPPTVAPTQPPTASPTRSPTEADDLLGFDTRIDGIEFMLYDLTYQNVQCISNGTCPIYKIREIIEMGYIGMSYQYQFRFDLALSL